VGVTVIVDQDGDTVSFPSFASFYTFRSTTSVSVTGSFAAMEWIVQLALSWRVTSDASSLSVRRI